MEIKYGNLPSEIDMTLILLSLLSTVIINKINLTTAIWKMPSIDFMTNLYFFIYFFFYMLAVK